MLKDEVQAGREGIMVRRDDPSIKIVGTAQTILATASAFRATRGPEGKLEPSYAGNTEVFWDTSETVQRGGEDAYVDENGDEVLESEVMLIEDTA